ncbi:MAG TPA: alpha-amylase family protein [Methylomirabilota bacterium]|nr:alpha-amylase family protein [Methylomirabilota bacterium]
MSMERPDATGLRKSGKALEESFFAKENERLLRKLQEQAEVAERRQALKEAMNLDDEQVIDALIAFDVRAETVAAFSIVPLVEVAWADGKIQPKERAAIIRAAEERGIQDGTPNHDLLESWLDHQPDQALMDTWKAYAHELHESLDPDVSAALKERMIARARGVAEAAGGFLGLGKISDAEQAILDELTDAFA